MHSGAILCVVYTCFCFLSFNMGYIYCCLSSPLLLTLLCSAGNMPGRSLTWSVMNGYRRPSKLGSRQMATSWIGLMSLLLTCSMTLRSTWEYLTSGIHLKLSLTPQGYISSTACVSYFFCIHLKLSALYVVRAMLHWPAAKWYVWYLEGMYGHVYLPKSCMQ